MWQAVFAAPAVADAQAVALPASSTAWNWTSHLPGVVNVTAWPMIGVNDQVVPLSTDIRHQKLAIAEVASVAPAVIVIVPPLHVDEPPVTVGSVGGARSISGQFAPSRWGHWVSSRCSQPRPPPRTSTSVQPWAEMVIVGWVTGEPGISC